MWHDVTMHLTKCRFSRFETDPLYIYHCTFVQTLSATGLLLYPHIVRICRGGKLKGKTLCFTGSLSIKRSVATLLAKSNGAKVTGSVSTVTESWWDRCLQYIRCGFQIQRTQERELASPARAWSYTSIGHLGRAFNRSLVTPVNTVRLRRGALKTRTLSSLEHAKTYFLSFPGFVLHVPQ